MRGPITKMWKRFSYKHMPFVPKRLTKYFTVKEPHLLFLRWYEEAHEYSPKMQPNLACLATVNGACQPVVRLLHIENVSDEGLKFYTCHSARKAGEIANNPNVAVLFFWPEISRSIRIEGIAKRLTVEESAEHFGTYPREKQITISLHQQDGTGQLVANRTVLDKFVDRVRTFFSARDSIEMPSNWGGYIINPHMYEFSEIRPNDKNECLLFQRDTHLKALNAATGDVCQGQNGWVYLRKNSLNG